MATADINQLKHDVLGDDCLHCRINAVIHLYYCTKGDERNGRRIISVPEALAYLADVAGQMIAVDPSPKGRRRFIGDFNTRLHEAISEGLKGNAIHPPDLDWPH